MDALLGLLGVLVIVLAAYLAARSQWRRRRRLHLYESILPEFRSKNHLNDRAFQMDEFERAAVVCGKKEKAYAKRVSDLLEAARKAEGRKDADAKDRRQKLEECLDELEGYLESRLNPSIRLPWTRMQ